MQKIFFISDLHFGHTNIMQYSPKYRQFKSVQEMDEYLIAMWNDTVGAKDIVYNLGDVSFHADTEKTERILKRLNGKHCLILGKHDKKIVREVSLQRYFDEITEYKFLKNGDFKLGLALFHYPILEWNNAHRGSVHLFGHIHDREAGLKGRAFNACYDYNGRFLRLEEVIKKAEKTDFHCLLHNDDDED